MAEDEPKLETFEGHKLQERISVSGTGDVMGVAAIRRAEEALSELTEQFDEWIQSEGERLFAAYERVLQHGYGGEAADELFRATHDIKGQAETMGYPYVTRVASLLCVLLEAIAEGVPASMQLIGVHVDAVRAILRDQIKGASDPMADNILEGLRRATVQYLNANPIPDPQDATSGRQGLKPVNQQSPNHEMVDC